MPLKFCPETLKYCILEVYFYVLYRVRQLIENNASREGSFGSTSLCVIQSVKLGRSVKRELLLKPQIKFLIKFQSNMSETYPGDREAS